MVAIQEPEESCAMQEPKTIRPEKISLRKTHIAEMLTFPRTPHTMRHAVLVCSTYI